MQRHPWNPDFQWLDRPGSFGALNREQVRQYDQHGYLVVPRLLDPAATAELRHEVDRLEADVDSEQRLPLGCARPASARHPGPPLR